MGEVFFVIKVFVITLVLVLFLQIRIGERTVDESIYGYLQTSSIVQPLDEVARGGVLFIQHGLRKIKSVFSQGVVDQIEQANAPGNRKILPGLKRYAEKVEEKVSEKTKEAAQKFHDRLMPEEEDYNY